MRYCLHLFIYQSDNIIKFMSVIFSWKMSKKRAELEARFKQLDRNKDGVVTLEEMRKELRDQGYPEGLAQKFMSQFDVDGNGSITMEEFVNTLSRTDNGLAE
ncbi:unnamed protein product [Trichobilharzia szidati]|nr:unnamed protein product [Trichobilharzia szidati]